VVSVQWGKLRGGGAFWGCSESFFVKLREKKTSRDCHPKMIWGEGRYSKNVELGGKGPMSGKRKVEKKKKGDSIHIIRSRRKKLSTQQKVNKKEV